MHIRFLGYLRPPGTRLEAVVANGPLRLLLSETTAGQASLSFAFEGERVVVDTTTERDVRDLPTFRNEILSVVRTTFDTFGYLSGRVLQVDLSEAVIDHTTPHLFVDAVESLYNSQDQRPVQLPDALQIAFGSVYAARALADLRRSMEYATDTGMFAFRAVEDVMQGFMESAEGEDRKRAWEAMRNSLRIDRSWIAVLEEASKPARHGASVTLTGAERVLLMERAWAVVDRYFAYLHGEMKALPVDGFPLLKVRNGTAG